MDTFSILQSFINESAQQGVYSKNVTHSVGTAFRMFMDVSTKEERLSLDRFFANLDDIAARLEKRKGLRQSSVLTYKSRIYRLLHDYSLHQSRVSKSPSVSPSKQGRLKGVSSVESVQSKSRSSIPHRVELNLRGGSKCIVIVPSDVTKAEVEKVKRVLDSLAVG